MHHLNKLTRDDPSIASAHPIGRRANARSRHPRAPHRWLALCGLLAANTVQADNVQWALFDSWCERGTSALEVACGDYGVFHFVDVQDPLRCERRAEGVADDAIYPGPNLVQQFPGTMIEILPRAVGATPGGQAGDAGLPQTAPGQAVAPLMLAPVPALDAQRTLQDADLHNPWIAVVDFDSMHGISTHWLADALSGPALHTELYYLDDTALAPLGQDITDLHVLAKLCNITDAVDTHGRVAPTAINMSFGRTPGQDDATNAESCAGERASCQVAKVAAHLRAKGSTLIAAAGNHKITLFPARLNEVLSAGTLELNTFFKTGEVQGTWESPDDVQARIPGNALCLRGGWPAPAGSSYSSAMLTGWIARTLKSHPHINAYDGNWQPRYSAANGCFELAQGDVAYAGCNAQVSDIFNGLQNGGIGSCWEATKPNTIFSGATGEPQSQPQVSAFDEWVAGNGPLPESDPCVPCVGNIQSGPVGDLLVNMSQSNSLPQALTLDKVYLRVNQDFYPLPLSAVELDWIHSAQVNHLSLPGWGSLVTGATPSSLMFVLKDASQSAACDAPPNTGCMWTSTPMFYPTL